MDFIGDATKFEIRISNIETNPKFKCPNVQDTFRQEFGDLVIRICFGFRASDFDIHYS